MTKKTQNFNYFKIDKYPHLTLATELFNTDLEHCHHCGKSYWAMLTILHLSVLLYVLLGVTALLNWRRQWQPTPVLLPGKSHGWRRLVGCSPWCPKSQTRLSDFTFSFHFHALEKEMATHSSVLAWRIPGTEEPDGLPSMGSHRVGHD